jgi:subtilase family serine protease
MLRLSRALLAATVACFLMQIPLSANAKEATRVNPTVIRNAPGTAKTVRPDSAASNAVKTFLPDLMVSKINYSPGKPITSSEITLWVFIKNNGLAPAKASGARIRVGGDTNAPVVDVPALNPGQEWRYTRKMTLSKATNYIVRVEADARKEVEESKEGNNVKTATILVKSELPDLVISKVNYSPGQPDTNSEITMWVFVQNVGLSQAGTSVAVSEIGPAQSAVRSRNVQSIPALNPGQEWRYSRKFTLDKAVTYAVMIRADENKNVAEAMENNNEKNINIAVRQGPKPDLVVTKINYSPGSPKQHEQVTVWYFVKNIGQGISQPCFLGTTNSLNAYSIWHKERVPALDPGREWRYQGLFLSNSAGKYKIKAVIDKDNTINEDNEGNNELLKDINVKKVN